MTAAEHRGGRAAPALAAVAAIILSATGCAMFRTTRHPAFDQLRVIRQGEPVSIEASSRDSIESVRTETNGRFQALPLELRLEPGLAWRQLLHNVTVVPADEKDTTTREFYLLGRDTVTLTGSAAVTPTVADEVYLFPRADEMRVRAADLTWAREAAGTLPTSWSLREHADANPGWSADSSGFYLVGLDAIAVGDSVIPTGSLAAADPARWQPFTGEFPVRPDAYPDAIVRVPLGFGGVDSVRVMGAWYRTRDPAAAAGRAPVPWQTQWRVRPVRRLLTEHVPRAARLEDLRPLLEGGVEDIGTAQEMFLSTLDFSGTRSARVLLACRLPDASGRPCFEAGRGYMLTIVTPRAGNAAVGLPAEFPLRVVRRNRLLGLAIGTTAVLLFLALSPSGQ